MGDSEADATRYGPLDEDLKGAKLRKAIYEERKDDILITSRYSDGHAGPYARVSADLERGWLYIVTDDYEGSAMLGLEALPHLRKALTKIARDLKRQKP